MPGFLLQVNVGMQCFHGAPVTTAPTQPRVLVGGQPVATATNQLWVVACPFALSTTPPKPQPCVRVQWLMFSTRILVNGQPVMLQTAPGSGSGICWSAELIPQGAPFVTAMQNRVIGS
jgi:hypothetical protein